MSGLIITGGLGLIGSAIGDAAAEAGYALRVIDDRRASVVDHVERAFNIDTMSVEDAAGKRFRDNPEAIVHCAAPVGPVGILGRNVLREMTTATEAAVAIARRHQIPLVVMSSSEVYGTERPGGSLVVPDGWSHRTEYGVGKIVTEQIAHRHHAETGLPTAIVRPWNVTGPRQAGSKGFVFPRLAAQAIAGGDLTVYQPGTQRRAFMDVNDFADGILEMLGRDHASPAWRCLPLDAATPENAISMGELARMFATHPLAAPTARFRLVDPQAEHGPTFREAASGSKLPPWEPAIKGTTRIAQMVDLAMLAANAPALAHAA